MWLYQSGFKEESEEFHGGDKDSVVALIVYKYLHDCCAKSVASLQVKGQSGLLNQ